MATHTRRESPMTPYLVVTTIAVSVPSHPRLLIHRRHPPPPTSLILKKDLGQELSKSRTGSGCVQRMYLPESCRPIWVSTWSTAHAARGLVELTRYPSRRS
ncbi:hypothetical protein MKEN_00758500 [Mycena kentingensis (nom. inval.)]|nr:hypothetical protein MKEN_00758500 [Mycena kentingensis (nom. inval.)]